MSGNLLDNPSFEDATLAPWQTTTGDVTRTVTATAFEGGVVATLDPTAAGDFSVISQLFQVGSGSHLHISFALRGIVTSGELTVEVQYFGSANIGLPLLRTDTMFVKDAGSLSAGEGWQTAVVAADAKPSGTVWARIRFVVVGIGVAVDGIDLDNVVVTAE